MRLEIVFLGRTSPCLGLSVQHPDLVMTKEWLLGQSSIYLPNIGHSRWTCTPRADPGDL